MKSQSIHQSTITAHLALCTALALPAQASAGDAESYRTMGDQYYFGTGVSQNYSRAFEFYKDAERLGDLPATQYIGYMYQHGLGVSTDHEKALYWYAKAAERGHEGAQYSLGYMHEYGVGTVINYAESRRWYEAAARQGHVTAMRQLGQIYARGLGVEPNLHQAAYYTALAAEQGDPTAAQHLERFVPHLQILEVQVAGQEIYKEPGQRPVDSLSPGDIVYQLANPEGEWFTVYDPLKRGLGYVKVDAFIPTAATAAGLASNN
ncbi:MAG TPA: tetratricopeptide repeat protein [Marinobacterium sp.]|nr:tetratricopeptide repeat protein [Marinobacterium sp.]